MPVNRTVLVLLVIAVVVSDCVEPYTPQIKESQESLVVEGLLTDRPGYQYIYISRSSPFNDPELLPEIQCQVSLVDDKGNDYPYDEQENGVYGRWMTPAQLTRGTAYKLIILTSGGERYESDYEVLSSPCPPVDSVYFEMETIETSDPDEPLQGIQVYIDLDAEVDQPRNYRWELVETWEYYAAHIIQYYFDGGLHNMPDPTIYYACWRTARISSIYTSSSKHLVNNRIHKYPLNYVSDHTNRLRIRYSLLVKQYTLSDNAYEYWDQMRKQTQEGGGLYETQPSQIRGNVYNINDPDEQVLGYFNISSSSEKRIFVDDVQGLSFRGPECSLDTIYQLSEIPDYLFPPIYLVSLNPMGFGLPYGVGGGMCFDCTVEGGINVKPDFWE